MFRERPLGGKGIQPDRQETEQVILVLGQSSSETPPTVIGPSVSSNIQRFTGNVKDFR